MTHFAPDKEQKTESRLQKASQPTSSRLPLPMGSCSDAPQKVQVAIPGVRIGRWPGPPLVKGSLPYFRRKRQHHTGGRRAHPTGASGKEEPPECSKAHSVEARPRGDRSPFSTTAFMLRRCAPDVHQLDRSSRQNCPRPSAAPEHAAEECSSVGVNRPRLARPPAPGTAPAARPSQVPSCTGCIDFLRGVPKRRAADSERSPPGWRCVSLRAVSRRRLESGPVEYGKCSPEPHDEARFGRRAAAGGRRPAVMYRAVRGARRPRRARSGR